VRGAFVVGLLLILAIGLGIAGASMLRDDHRKQQTAEAASPYGPAVKNGPVTVIPAVRGGVPYIGGEMLTLAAQRGGSSFSVRIPQRIPELATASVVMSGTTAPNTPGDSSGQRASIYLASAATCPATAADASTHTGADFQRLITGDIYEFGAFRLADLPTVSLKPGPAVACAYLGWHGRGEISARRRILITPYRPGVFAKREATFPTGTYVARSGVQGAKSVTIRITRGRSPWAQDRKTTYFAQSVRANHTPLATCRGGASPGSPINATLVKTLTDKPAAFIGQSVAVSFIGPSKGDLVAGFSGDGALHGTVSVQSAAGKRACAGSVAFTAHHVG